MIFNRFLQIAWVAPLLIAVLHLPMTADAGGHVQKWPEQPDIKLDPEKRSEITGTVLVTGANRGIGLQLATNYTERGWTVIATARKPEKADDLNALAAKHENLSVEYLDLLDHEGIDKLADKLRDVPIDVLFNNAAILGDPQGQDFGNFDYELMKQVYAVNTIGTFKLAEAFFNHVAASDQKKIVAMTSQQGSIGALRDPLIPYYKMSKTAVNMGMSTVARRIKKQKVTIVLISPGAVDTKMMNDALDHAGFKGGGFLITPAQSAEAVINVVDQYDFELSGTFMSHRGDVIPW